MCVEVPQMCVKSPLQEVPAPGKAAEGEDRVTKNGACWEREKKKMVPTSWRQAEESGKPAPTSLHL